MRLAATSIQYHPLPLTQAEISQRFQHRRELLRQTCDRYKDSSPSSSFHLFQPLSARKVILEADWPARNTSVVYCPIQKTGSTTWSHVIRQAMKERRRQQPPLLQKKPRGREKEMAHEVKFLFVRDPYSRLLSGYVDKLFSPNTMFWKNTGAYIVQNFRRHDPSNVSLRCGHDVTFEEYVRYVVDSQRTLEHRNGHFVPIHDHCGLCRTDYTYIGHLETLREDMPFLLEAFHLPRNRSELTFDSHTIKDNAGWVLKSMKAKIQRCMSMHEACVRLWKKWHIRGVISKDQPLPVTPEEAETISAKEFVSRALESLERSGDRERRKRQKVEALREAFASLPEDLRVQVGKMMRLDCELFGFDPKPEGVFSSSWVPLGRGERYRYFDLSEAVRFQGLMPGGG